VRISTEPSYLILSWNIHKLSLTNVQLFHCAISDMDGVVAMEIPRYRGGGEGWTDAKIVFDPSGKGFLRKLEVPARTIDSFACDLQRPVSFVKCDVEYHELHCICSGVETIRRWRPVMLIEMLGNPDEDASDRWKIVEFLRQFGYMPCLYDGKEFQPRGLASGAKTSPFFLRIHLHLQ
jgi:FkbM family methyltransferase